MREQRQERNQTFQMLTVIGIISVIMGHVDLDTLPLMNTWFTPYSYHMALFVFISGYFYKAANHASVKSAAGYTLKKIKSLLLPLFVWNIIYGIGVYILSFKDFQIGVMPDIYSLFVAPFIDGPLFVYNMCGWFVMPLFLVEMLFVWGSLFMTRLMDKKQSKELVITCIVAMVLFALALIGIKMAIMEKHSPIELLYIKTSFFAVFFMLGHCYNKYLEKIDNAPHIVYFGVLLFIQLCILYFAEGRLDYVISNGKQFENGVFLPFVTAVTGIAFYLRIARILAKGIGASKAVDVICKNAYSIMMHQFAGFMFVKGMIGVCQRFLGIFPDFSIPVMKVNIWYYYYPRNTAAFGIVYIVGGLVVPIVIGSVQRWIVNACAGIAYDKYHHA